MQAPALRARHVAATAWPQRGHFTPASVQFFSPFATCRRSSTTTAPPFPPSFLSPESLAQQSNNVFISSFKNPILNLAIENHLLTHCNPSSRTLFFYRNRPCVVIGRNQNPWVECDLKRLRLGLEDNLNVSKRVLEEIKLVRRRSGGGTVFHDLGNLNYSVIVPNNSAFTRALYPNMVVQALKTIDDKLDVKVNERNDIVIQRDGNWFKVSGSAYKLTRGRALAHGTLLFASQHLHSISGLLRSPGKDFFQARGVESVRSAVANIWTDQTTPEELSSSAEMLMESIKQTWMQQSTSQNLTLVSAKLDIKDISPNIIRTELMELGSAAWRFGQTPGFEATIRGHDAGGLELKFEVKQGIIEKVFLNCAGVTFDDELHAASLKNRLNVRLKGQKLAEIDNWRELLSECRSGHLQVDDALLTQLEILFPPLNQIPFSGSPRSQQLPIRQIEGHMIRNMEKGFHKRNPRLQFVMSRRPGDTGKTEGAGEDSYAY